MELKIDLREKQGKSLFRVILGVLFIIISVAWIINRVIQNLDINLFDWFYSIIFALNGIIHIVGGFGSSFEDLFGETYVLVNEELISLKLNMFFPGQSIYWKDIKSIEYKINRYQINKVDNTNITLDLSSLSYAYKQQVKESIDAVIEEKVVSK